ncbi:MAG: sigma 54-interacting transcriptional regulator [Clostridia bacterium]|nr:sigma 54-interacting transcriptional regulator [Clostridia bacterium]
MGYKDTGAEPLLVKNLMEHYPLVLEAELCINEALELMVEHKLTQAPVVDQRNYLGRLSIFSLLGLVKLGKAEEKIKLWAEKRDTLLDIEEDLAGKELKREEFYPVVDEQSHFKGIVYHTRLEQEKRNQLKREVLRLGLVMESTHNGIFAIDNRGTIIIFNSAAERMLGLKAKDVLGKYVLNSIPETGTVRVLNTGKSEYSQKVVTRGKTYVSNRSPLYHQGELVGVVAVFQDITELEQVSSELETVKRLNMELDTIINSSYDGLMITDENGTGIKINNALSRVTGLKEKHFVGKSIEDLYKSGVFHSQAITVRALKEGRRVTGIQKVNTGKEVLVTGNPVFDSEGRVIRVVTNVRDITELNRLQEELEETKALSAKYHSELSKLKGQIAEESKIITNNRKVKEIYDLAGRVAQSDVTVLILGESGVGKEGVARMIHSKSSRDNSGQFIQINCGAIPENLLESELFGYEPGAFTGAHKSGKKGLFEMAHQGTIFLDEISELPLLLQVKLLRVLQEQELYRLGGTTPIKLDVRIVAASNKNLRQQVDEGKFREDLFYRLNVVPLELPPLRDRPEDILPLVLYYVKYFNEKYKTNKTFSPGTIAAFQRCNWPGNIRELINVVERLIVTSLEDLINIEQINSQTVMLQPVKSTPISVTELVPLKEAKQILERQLVNMALKRYPSIRGAAQALGVTHSLILYKISQYKLKDAAEN